MGGEHAKILTSKKIITRSSAGLVLRWADFRMLKPQTEVNIQPEPISHQTCGETYGCYHSDTD